MNSGAQICAVVVAADTAGLFVLTLRGAHGRGPVLPVTPFDPRRGQGFEERLRDWISIHTTTRISCILQAGASVQDGCICVCLLALAPDRNAFMPKGARWSALTGILPWETRLKGAPEAFSAVLRPALNVWAESGSSGEAERRQQRLARAFGGAGQLWQPALAQARYSLLYEAGLVPEALRDRSGGAVSVRTRRAEIYGQTMPGQDRLMLAGALCLLRRRIARTPLMAALAPSPFSLGSVQKTAEAIMGLPLHTQNFRRDIVRCGQIESTGERGRVGGGRVAQLWRWRKNALQQGLPLPLKPEVPAQKS